MGQTKQTLNEVMAANRAGATVRLANARTEPFDNFVGYIRQARQMHGAGEIVSTRRLGNMALKSQAGLLAVMPQSSIRAIDLTFAISGDRIVSTAHKLVLAELPAEVRKVVVG